MDILSWVRVCGAAATAATGRVCAAPPCCLEDWEVQGSCCVDPPNRPSPLRLAPPPPPPSPPGAADAAARPARPAAEPEPRHTGGAGGGHGRSGAQTGTGGREGAIAVCKPMPTCQTHCPSDHGPHLPHPLAHPILFPPLQIQLREWFPAANLGMLLARRPTLLTAAEWGGVAAARDKLHAMFPEGGVDDLVRTNGGGRGGVSRATRPSPTNRYPRHSGCGVDSPPSRPPHPRNLPFPPAINSR